VLVTTRFTNLSALPLETQPADSIRADRTFEHGPQGASGLFWFYDHHFGQAYGVVAERRDVLPSASRELLIRFQDKDQKVAMRLAPGESQSLVRRIIPGANLFDVQKVAAAIAGTPEPIVRLTVKDTAGKPIAGADVSFERDGKTQARGRTDEQGAIEVTHGDGAATLKVSALGHGTKSVDLAASGPETLGVELPEAGAVVAHITDEQGAPIPCKVQFRGRNGTETPDFGPDSGEIAVRNLYYTADGKFRQKLGPGSYDVIVSYGPEYDAIFTKIDVQRGKETPLDAKLIRSVKTDGWVSGDFHSHSSPSGDNTSSQLGRVLNLLCEHIEFAPCTEHNRLSTYDPHLKRLGAVGRMATCVGIELTGSPLPLNHQNAFPLVLRPRTQDGGGPTPDADPETQIERLAFWDGGAEKLVQVNHPDLGWMFRDRNGDGKPDAGFSGMFGHMDVIEVHPPDMIFGDLMIKNQGRSFNNTILNWIQLLNSGRRIPGVVNTDAHYNFHGSGFLRNYLKSPTDNPAEIQTLDIVHAAERGNLVMSNGPFLEVSLRAGSEKPEVASPGDSLPAPGGETTLKMRVQCPNWFDVDRVQVFINGRPAEPLNFTRRSTPDKFSNGVVKFEQEIPLKLDRDAHVIVATIGEGSKLGTVAGPDHENDRPVAVSNPIFVDVDGGGFKPNGDTLGKLSVKSSD
jgi:hypothetical protein